MSRSCDATNLNLSPLCNILSENNDKEVSAGLGWAGQCELRCVQATMWGEAARQSYDPANTPDYASSILGPMRSYYTSRRREERELLSANIRVNEMDKHNLQLSNYI